MRVLFAKLLVVVTGVLIVGLAVLFAWIRNPTHEPPATVSEQAVPTSPKPTDVVPAEKTSASRPPDPAAVERGRAIYAEQRCRVCHSLEGEGNSRSPLDGVAARLSERDIRRWIVAPREMNPAVAKRGYQLPPEDLDALVAYLTATSPR